MSCFFTLTWAFYVAVLPLKIFYFSWQEGKRQAHCQTLHDIHSASAKKATGHFTLFLSLCEQTENINEWKSQQSQHVDRTPQGKKNVWKEFWCRFITQHFVQQPSSLTCRCSSLEVFFFFAFKISQSSPRVLWQPMQMQFDFQLLFH